LEPPVYVDLLLQKMDLKMVSYEFS
jgi:hypothetical protein